MSGKLPRKKSGGSTGGGPSSSGGGTGSTPQHQVIPGPGDDIVWPPNNGFDGPPVRKELPVGETVDRYGHPGGKFVAEAGTPYGQRALPPGSDSREFHTYRVVKPFEVDAGPAAPWFGEPGGGTQYLFPKRISELIDEGYLEEV